jgi:hypothetical protein
MFFDIEYTMLTFCFVYYISLAVFVMYINLLNTEYYMSKSVSHAVSTREPCITPRATGPRCDIDRGLIRHVIQILTCNVHYIIYFNHAFDNTCILWKFRIFLRFWIFLNFEHFLKNFKILWNYWKFWNFEIFWVYDIGYTI